MGSPFLRNYSRTPPHIYKTSNYILQTSQPISCSSGTVWAWLPLRIPQTFYHAKANCSWLCIESRSFHGGTHIGNLGSSASCRLDSDTFADYFRLWKLQYTQELDTNRFRRYFSVHTVKDQIFKTSPSILRRCSLEYPPLTFIFHIQQDREYQAFSGQLVLIYGRECIFCERCVHTQVYQYLRVWDNLYRSGRSCSLCVFVLLIPLPWEFVISIFY